ncbi:hypothetical protein BDF20DRAFT_714067 [Mycotypha africana]|uniref:uncharacterized protein n=1 Tax=Mycotypha africana TaxID=64632 RepID=UPI0023013CF6|nr:uncharacterized protein BDF20DRAFT_714067 [Mycotypha africana]KAI8971996.1 hypothetical protein BDF20DRAFT_714067 [Mycotypha africana]
MPTTRFATATGKAATTDLDSSTSSAVESPKEVRRKAFQSRKRRERPTDLAKKQSIMVEFIDTIIKFDKKHLLWSKAPNVEKTTIEYVIDRVYKGKYKDFNSLKLDLDILISSIAPLFNQSREELYAFKDLYAYINKSLSLEASRANEELKETENAVDFVSLFRPTTDGYAFSDLLIKDNSAGPKINYMSNVHELIVHPAQPTANDQVPKLKDVVAPAPKYHPKVIDHGSKPIVPVQWLDFGAFSSFAPASDSRSANTTYENTYMGRAAKRLKKEKSSESSKTTVEDMETNEEELNAAWLKEQGLDIQLMNNALEIQADKVMEELEKNSKLFEKLLDFQKSRFSKDESKWALVDEKEFDAAKSLKENILKILQTLPPNVITDAAILEEAMKRLPVFEAAYRGTLPPHKIFSFPTTEKAEGFPPYANITPTYPKENWRLLRVTPFPAEKASDANAPNSNQNEPPLLSMLEQQQLHLMQKAPPLFSQQLIPHPSQMQQPPPHAPPQQQQCIPMSNNATMAYPQSHQRR